MVKINPINSGIYRGISFLNITATIFEPGFEKNWKSLIIIKYVTAIGIIENNPAIK